MTDAEYERFVKDMAAEHGLSSTQSRRRGMEVRYFLHHKSRGVRLRKKYRIR